MKTVINNSGMSLVVLGRVISPGVNENVNDEVAAVAVREYESVTFQESADTATTEPVTPVVDVPVIEPEVISEPESERSTESE